MKSIVSSYPKCINMVIFLLFFNLILCHLGYSQNKGNKNLLIFHSYHQGLQWTDRITAGILDTLKQVTNMDIEYDVEYMNTKRIQTAEYYQALYSFYQLKYQNSHFDVIICSDNNAFNFLVQHRQTLFSNTPIVFCGVNNFSDDLLKGEKAITGVVEDFDMKSTLNLALNIHPKTTDILVINDNGTSGKENKKILNKLISNFSPQLKFIFYEDLTISEILLKAKSAPATSIIFITGIVLDDNGNVIPFGTSTKIISQRLNIPCYSLWDFHLGYGIVGGMLTTGYHQGKNAAELALAILNGKKADSIPILKKSPNKYMFDFNQLQRFKIDESSLPPERVIINKPGSFYEKNKGLIWTGIGILIFLSFLLFLSYLYIYNLKKIKRKLEGSEKQLKLALEAAKAGMWDYQSQQNYFYFNSKCFTMLGYQKTELTFTYENWIKLIHPENKKIVARQLKQYTQDGVDFNMEFRVKTNNNEWKWINTIGNVVEWDENGKATRYIGIHADITERKKVENQLEQLIKDLEKKNSELERFTYTVSHDLRSPLITIKGFLGMLLADMKNNKKEQMLADIKRISNAADKMNQLLDDLLELSRIGRLQNSFEPLPIRELVQDAIELLHGQLSKHKVDLIIANDFPKIPGNRKRILELFQNLIDNAIKFMGDQIKPKIEIGWQQINDKYSFYVKDNGIGIYPQYHHKIFGLFEQLEQEKNGSGIGLAIVKRIVETHGGEIWLESDGITGTTFYFTLNE